MSGSDKGRRSGGREGCGTRLGGRVADDGKRIACDGRCLSSSDGDKGRRSGGREGCGIAPERSWVIAIKTIIYTRKSSVFELHKVILFRYFVRYFSHTR